MDLEHKKECSYCHSNIRPVKLTNLPEINIFNKYFCEICVNKIREKFSKREEKKKHIRPLWKCANCSRISRKKKVIIKITRILGPSRNGISQVIRSLQRPNPSPPFARLKIIKSGYARMTTNDTKIRKTTTLNKNIIKLF